MATIDELYTLCKRDPNRYPSTQYHAADFTLDEEVCLFLLKKRPRIPVVQGIVTATDAIERKRGRSGGEEQRALQLTATRIGTLTIQGISFQAPKVKNRIIGYHRIGYKKEKNYSSPRNFANNIVKTMTTKVVTSAAMVKPTELPSDSMTGASHALIASFQTKPATKANAAVINVSVCFFISPIINIYPLVIEPSSHLKSLTFFRSGRALSENRSMISVRNTHCRSHTVLCSTCTNNSAFSGSRQFLDFSCHRALQQPLLLHVRP